MTSKKIDLGEYIVKIDYDENNGMLNVEVLDELGDIIESINITDDENDEEDDLNFGFNLN